MDGWQDACDGRFGHYSACKLLFAVSARREANITLKIKKISTRQTTGSASLVIIGDIDTLPMDIAAVVSRQAVHDLLKGNTDNLHTVSRHC